MPNWLPWWLKHKRGKAPFLSSLSDLAERVASTVGSIEAANHRVLQSALWASAAAAALAVALAILLGLAMTRSLLRQLGGEPGAAADLARSVSQGDLTVHIDVKPGDSSSLMAQLKAMQDSLSTVVGNVRLNSEAVANASQQIAQGNQDLSRRTEQQATALQETAASMEQLGSTVKQNADNAKLANPLAQGASTVAVMGGAVVGQVVETMRGINDSSKRIADIIGVIDGIAFQTNILALNAAVEAARVTDIMGEISAASTEQSTGVALVGEAMSRMDQATQQNSALVEESSAEAESLKCRTRQLVEAVAVFKLVRSEVPAPVSVANDESADRLGPDRAKNVTWPTVSARSSAGATVAESTATHQIKTGTDGAWSTF